MKLELNGHSFAAVEAKQFHGNFYKMGKISVISTHTLSFLNFYKPKVKNKGIKKIDKSFQQHVISFYFQNRQ